MIETDLLRQINFEALIKDFAPRFNIIVKCLALNSEFNFQSGQTSYTKII
jgi:hypothetical protein